MRTTKLITTTIFCLCVCIGVRAAADSTRVYSQEAPLVYEDVWDLWPYTFLNEEGQPDGFNIDLIRMLMKELNIPYVIKLKPSSEAFRDLKEGKSDLMLGLAVGFHDEFGKYSQNAVTLFTQSVVTPKKKKVEVRRFHDLSNVKVIVNDSSLCHHLMIEYGWGENAIPVEDMREAIQQVSAQEEGQIVWNTLSLKWLMRRYHTDNLELTTVNMQHGQYKFMSNDQHLLDLLDEAYTRLYSADRLTPIQNKWFYPERQEKTTKPWVLWFGGVSALLLLVLAIYAIIYSRQAKRLNDMNARHNKRLALIMDTSHVHVWTYDVENRQFAWHNENGATTYVYSIEEFSQRYSEEDFARLTDALHLLEASTPDDHHDQVTMNLQAKDFEEGDTEMRDYYVVVSVLYRDKHGHPTQLIGTKKDVTDQRRQQQQFAEKTLHYWSIFHTDTVGIMLFNSQGILVNINPAACNMLHCQADDLRERHLTMDDIIGTGKLTPEQADGFYATQICRPGGLMQQRSGIVITQELYLETHLMTIRDEKQEVSGVFAICRNITQSKQAYRQKANKKVEHQQVQTSLKDYKANIDRILHDDNIRIVSYSPASHALTICHSIGEVQHVLTQTRCMTLVDDNSKKLSMRLLNDMDNHTYHTIEANIRTTLRIPGGLRLCLLFMLKPQYDHQGNVTHYLGLCSDQSELASVNQQMKKETAKVQEAEETKNSFVRNMVQEIRNPLDTMTQQVARLDANSPTDNEESSRKGILQNADYLLHFIENILYLSRLEAHMVEINRQPTDFAAIFESQCAAGWEKHQNAQTRYIVENPYEVLKVDIDAAHLGEAIRQITGNASQHTKNGFVKARYDYLGRRLIISVDDTGDGISKQELTRINDSITGVHNTKGLGIAICHQLVNQMSGMLEISSEEGSGTTVYITIPCHASEIKRKKIISEMQ